MRFKAIIEKLKGWSWRKKAALALLVLAVPAAAWQLGKGKDGGDAAQLGPVKADPRVIAEGIVMPVKYGALSLPVSGVVAELLVAEGQMVQPGQPLVRLVNDDVTARAKSTQADLNRAQAKLQAALSGSRPQEVAMKRALVDQALAAYEAAGADFERIERLYNQQAVSRQEYDKARASQLKTRGEWEHAKADYEMAAAGTRPEEIKAAEADAAAARENHNQALSLAGQTELRAPFAGTVAFLDHKMGEYVPAGQPLVRLGELTAWQVQTDDLTEIQIAKVREGAKVTMTFDGLPGVELPGKVTAIRSFGEKKRGDITYTVYITPDYFEPRLKWNMTAVVKIDAE